ncbi:MAG: hypothetical protein SWN98_06730 [Pseudomonadota bacterium]|nr:hypothetical protein [Pseudomonadota bacterium]
MFRFAGFAGALALIFTLVAPAPAQTTRYDIMDNQGFAAPMVAYTVEVPQGWATSGQVLWAKPCSGNDNFELVFQAIAPDGRTGFRIMPGHQVIWLDMQVAGLAPDMAQMMRAQMAAERNKMQTQFRGSNCHVAQVTGTQQLFDKLILAHRPADARILQSERNQPMLQSYASVFQADQPGMKTFYDAATVRLGYGLNGQPVEEVVLFSWYMFQLEPLEPGFGTFSQQTVVDSIRTAWVAPERRAADDAKLEAIIGSMKVNPDWNAKVNAFLQKQSSERQAANAQTAAERERQRQIDEARRDAQHQQFIDMIRQ